MRTAMSQKSKSSGGLTGKHVLFILLGFFGVMLAVNIYFTIKAVKSFPGEDVPRSYLQGIEYNKTLQARAAQDASGWSAAVNTAKSGADEQTLILKMNDRSGRGISGLTVTGKLRHPTDTSLDKDIVLVDAGGGIYRAKLGSISGQWGLIANARQGEFIFTLTQDLWAE